jgi:hypothetical protein
VQCAPAYPIYPPTYVQPQTYPAPRHALPPPRIETSPKTATPTPAPAPGNAGAIDTNIITRPTAGENVRPAASSDSAPPMPKKATDATPPKKADPPAVAPDPLPKFPEVVIPKDIGPLPKLEVPKGAADPTPKAPTPAAVPDPAPAPDLKLPPIDFPKDTGPKLPPLPSPGTTAVPAPAPPPEPLIPSPSVPAIPDPAKKDSLPSLTLPPDIPITRESKSSPLTGGRREMTVSVFPAGGEQAVRGGYRTVGFYNHTARDLNLTIEGRSVKLPARSYLHAQLAATFTWGHGDRPLVRETVPAGAAGVDVVFRE